MLTSINTTPWWQRLSTPSVTNSCTMDRERVLNCSQLSSWTCFNQRQCSTPASYPNTRQSKTCWASRIVNKSAIPRLFYRKNSLSLLAKSLYRQWTKSGTEMSTVPLRAFPKTKASWQIWMPKWTDTAQSLKNKGKGFKAELCCPQ